MVLHLPSTRKNLLWVVLLLFVYYVQGAVQNACDINEDYTIRFKISKKGPLRKQPENVFDAIEEFFWSDFSSTPEIFITKTTGLPDICTIETLSTSYKTSKDATIQAVKASKNRKLQENGDRRLAKTTSTKNIRAMYVVARVYGTPGLEAMKLQQVSKNLASRFDNKVKITTTIDKGPVSLKSIKAKVTNAEAPNGGLPERSHTFAAYASSETFKDYTPVIVVDTEFSNELPYDLTSVSDNSSLTFDQCWVKNVYQSPRKAQQWTPLNGGDAYNFFALKKHWETSIWRLTVSLAKINSYYRLRYQTNYTPPWGLSSMLSNLGLGFLNGRNRKGRVLVADDSSNSSAPLPAASPTDTASIQNYATADFANDFAIVFSCAGTPQDMRMDVTIIPKILRSNEASSALVCLPGVSDGLKSSSQVESGVPKLSSSNATCPTFPMRHNGTRILDSETFAGLHPEEEDWLAKRLLKTSPKIAAFIEANLPGGGLGNGTITSSNGAADLKIALAMSGGGKRALFNAAGVSSGLSKAGILNLTTWMAGASGGAWILGGLYGASLNKTTLVEPGQYVNDHVTDLTKAMFDTTFKANDIMTNFGSNQLSLSLPIAPFNDAGAGEQTNQIFCQTELKLQSPLIPPTQAQGPVLADYWSRAIGYQVHGAAMEGGYGLTMSGLAKDPLIANQDAPLPIMHIQQNTGDGTNNELYRIFEVSPFDIATHNGDLHVSYPTELLGSTPTDPEKSCATQSDQLSYLMGLSSWYFAVANDILQGTIKDLVCGQDGSACQPVPMYNPFQGYTGPSSTAAPDLFSATENHYVDGAMIQNNALWGFITPTRQADIVFVVDSAGGGADAPMSTDPGTQCSASDGGWNQCPSGKFYAPDWARCCNVCSPLSDIACWPSPNTADNDLFNLKSYGPNTLPNKWPVPNTNTAPLNKVTFFGCDEPNTTAIVYFPHRIVSSGKGGFTAIRGVADLNPAYNVPGNMPITTQDAKDILKNGEDQLPATFNGCLSCLMYASLPTMDRATFWSNHTECSSCYSEYCYQ